jgi:hypothetical protein
MQLMTNKRHYSRNIRSRLALVAIVVLAATAALAGTAKAQVGLPNGASVGVDVSCDPVLTDFNLVYRYAGSGYTYALLWVYSYPDGRWHNETGWTKLTGDTFSAFYDGSLASSWVAMYAQYATSINGQWKYSGEWIQMTDNTTNQTDYWCGF